MKKISTAKIKSQAAKKKVTVGIDLGDRSSRYCLLDEEGLVRSGKQALPRRKRESRKCLAPWRDAGLRWRLVVTRRG